VGKSKRDGDAQKVGGRHRFLAPQKYTWSQVELQFGIGTVITIAREASDSNMEDGVAG